ncbi:hypothetical protein [Nocardioides pakistanensis]
MTRNLIVGVAGFAAGAVLGLLGWWLLWSPVVSYLMATPEPWEMRDGTLVINDVFAAIGKVLTLFLFPRFAGVQVAGLAVDRFGE